MDWMTIGWIAILVVIFYFMLIRPSKKREKADKELRRNLRVGDEIVTIGGFTGTIIKVKDDDIVFTSGADKTKLSVKKWAVQTRLSPEQEALEEETDTDEDTEIAEDK